MATIAHRGPFAVIAEPVYRENGHRVGSEVITLHVVLREDEGTVFASATVRPPHQTWGARTWRRSWADLSGTSGYGARYLPAIALLAETAARACGHLDGLVEARSRARQADDRDLRALAERLGWSPLPAVEPDLVWAD